LYLYLVDGLEHKAGGVGGEEEEVRVQGDAGDGVLQPPHPHHLLTSPQQQHLSLNRKTNGEIQT